MQQCFMVSPRNLFVLLLGLALDCRARRIDGGEAPVALECVGAALSLILNIHSFG
jgi:hypothetical protein